MLWKKRILAALIISMGLALWITFEERSAEQMTEQQAASTGQPAEQTKPPSPQNAPSVPAESAPASSLTEAPPSETPILTPPPFGSPEVSSEKPPIPAETGRQSSVQEFPTTTETTEAASALTNVASARISQTPAPEQSTEKETERETEAREKTATEKSEEAAIDESLADSGEGSKEIVAGTVEQGDTAAKLLGNDVRDILQVSNKYHSLANIRSGQPYVVIRDKETRALERFEYEIDAQRKLVVESDGSTFSARVESIIYDIQLALLQGVVESSLFQSVAALGEAPSLALVVADVFRWDVDFIKDVQDGDSFSILVEKRFRDGQFKNYGRVLGAAFTNKGKTFEAFLFRGISGHESHYNKKGESLKKVLLKAPLAFTRITSGYSMGRKHPIFHDVRPHEGVDYAAPTGTPIKAVGDGVVIKRGWQGGYGNTLVLRHGAGLESQYGHMSGYARGMTVGVHVRQGQVIGFVGSTGWATGPHLDFRLKQNGRFINPIKAVNPREESIASGRMAAFGERVVRIRQFWLGETPLNEYKSEKFQ